MEIYLQLHHSLSQRGLATRSRVECERQLCLCRQCPHFDDRGCSRMGTREFAAFLADATKSCKEFADRDPKNVV